MQEKDSYMYAMCANYVTAAVSVSIDHYFSGKKARSKFPEEPMLMRNSLTEEEQIERAIASERQWAAASIAKGLPQTIIKK